MATLSDFSVVQTLSDEQRRKYHNAQGMVRDLSDRVDLAHQYFEMMRSNYPNCILRTPMLKVRWLCTHSLTTYMKLETEQVTGSFKARGALYFSKRAKDAAVERIVTASTGNHAMGIVHALSYIDCLGTLYLPANSAPSKIEAIRKVIGHSVELSPDGTASVDLKLKGTDCVEAELAAIASCQYRLPEKNGKLYAETEENVVYASPYNDIDVISGNGTVGREILEDLGKAGTRETKVGAKCVCYVTVGGGGLISGIASKLKTSEPGKWRIVGCLPSNSATMYESVRFGRVMDVVSSPTLSDGSAGGLQPGTITLDLCGNLVDAWAMVTEREIGNAMARVFIEQRKVLEGAAGVAVAGFLRDASWRKQNDCSTAIIVACGGNVEVETFGEIIGGRYKYDTNRDTDGKTQV